MLTARGAATDDLVKLAAALASDPDYAARLVDKRRRRAADEAEKPLEAYRNEELRRMRLNFYGFDPSYHVARYNFIHKAPKSRTPLTIANHGRGVSADDLPAWRRDHEHARKRVGHVPGDVKGTILVVVNERQSQEALRRVRVDRGRKSL